MPQHFDVFRQMIADKVLRPNGVKKYLEIVRPALIKKHEERGLFLDSYGNRISCQLVGLTVKKYLTQAGLKHFSTHSLRHAFASHLLQAGCQIKYIQEMLGHSQIDTTQIYTHLKKEDLLNTLERFHPLGCAN